MFSTTSRFILKQLDYSLSTSTPVIVYSAFPLINYHVIEIWSS